MLRILNKTSCNFPLAFPYQPMKLSPALLGCCLWIQLLLLLLWAVTSLGKFLTQLLGGAKKNNKHIQNREKRRSFPWRQPKTLRNIKVKKINQLPKKKCSNCRNFKFFYLQITISIWILTQSPDKCRKNINIFSKQVSFYCPFMPNNSWKVRSRIRM